MIYELTEIENIKDKRVVLLNSGGLESCYLSCLLNHYGFEIHHLFIDYSQNALQGERIAVENLIKTYGGELHTAKLDLPWFKNSTVLCSGDMVGDPLVHKYMGTVEAKTYVPLRNHIFLSLAGSLADSLKIPYVASGLDGIQDCFGIPVGSAPDKHPNFAYSIENSINEASSYHHTDGGYIELIAPILCCSKEDTISKGTEINCDFSLSWSCYNSGDMPCGICCACTDRKSHFENLGLDEPKFSKII